MYAIAHYVLLSLYVALPAAASAFAIRPPIGDAATRRRTRLTVIRLFCSGGVIGTLLCFVYAIGVNARPTVFQVLKAGYFATALLIGLDLVNRPARAGLRRLIAGKLTAQNPRPRGRLFLADLLRAVVMVFVFVPFVMAAVMVYRPRVIESVDPAVLEQARCEPVRFAARDGTSLAGWWLPAAQSARTPQSSTVILCHGLGAGKGNTLPIALAFTQAGFNVFVFDFRAHGESGGQLSSFGDRERLDVTAAVDWVRANKANDSRRLFGVGASMGAAALIAAASDDTLARNRFDAVAVIGTYDSLPRLADAIATRNIPQPFGWTIKHFGLVLASAHVGENLAAFEPGAMVAKIWPTPVMTVHGTADEIIPFAAGQRLDEAAAVPKTHIWVTGGTHNGVLSDNDVIQSVIEFLLTARPTPVI